MQSLITKVSTSSLLTKARGKVVNRDFGVKSGDNFGIKSGDNTFYYLDQLPKDFKIPFSTKNIIYTSIPEVKEYDEEA